MMTVVDQVRPWLTPSRTLATMIHPHVGAHINSSGTGSADEPSGDEHRFAPVAVREGAGEEVGRGLHGAERDDEGERAENAASPKTCSASSGRTVRSWPIMPPTSALTPTSSRNWARFSRSPSRIGRRLPAVVGASSSAGRQRSCRSRVDQALNPPSSTRDVAVAGAVEDAGGGHGPFALPHIVVTGPSGRSRVGERTQLDVSGARDVPGGELVVLADVEHASRRWRRVRPARMRRRPAGRLRARRRCRRRVAGEVSCPMSRPGGRGRLVLVVVERRRPAVGRVR